MNLESKLLKLLGVITGRKPTVRPVCSICGRPLYATSSIDRGMGATCAGWHAKKDTRTLSLFDDDFEEDGNGSAT